MIWLKLISPIFLVLSIPAQYGVDYIWRDRRKKLHHRIRRLVLILQVLAGLVTVIVIVCDFKTAEKQNSMLNQIVEQSRSNEAGSAQRDEATQEEVRKLKDQVTILSDKLSPFSQLAANRYPNLPEDTALAKLAKEIADVRRLAEPNKLTMRGYNVKKSDLGFLVLLLFQTTKNEQLGMLNMLATLTQESKGRILALRPSPLQGLYISYKNQLPRISDDGRMARLVYKPLAQDPAIELEVSGPVRVRIEANPELSPFEIEIKEVTP